MTRGTGKFAPVGVFIAVVAVLGVATAPTHAAWTPATTVTSESSPGDPNLELNDQVIRQAVRDDGSSIAAWVASPPGSTQIRAQLINRDGTLSGAPITVASAPGPVAIDPYEIVVAPLGDGYVFFWTEAFSAGTNFAEIAYRTVSSTGAVGDRQTMTSTSVAANAGRLAYSGLSAASGGGFLNFSWGFRSRTGAAANNCEDEFYFEPANGPCTVTQQATFTRLRSDGSFAISPTNLIDRQFTSEATRCYFYPHVGTYTNTVPSSGATTVVMDDSCRPVGGQITPSLLYSIVPAAGSPSSPRLFTLGNAYDTSIASNGATLVSTYDELYRISASGQVSEPEPLDAVTVQGGGWNPIEHEVLALPNNQAIVIWTADRAVGDDLERAVWGRLVKTDNSLGQRQQLLSRTFTASGPGTPDDSGLELSSAVGLGRETGTILVGIKTLKSSPTAATGSREVVAIGLNRQGGKGSESTIAAESVDWNPAIQDGGANAELAIRVSSDGTASALALTTIDKALSSPPFTGSAEATISSGKLLRNPNTCGVKPSLCKANVKVKGLKVSGRGANSKLTITLKNSGNKDASKVKAKLTVTSGSARVPKTVTFPKVLEGKTAKKAVKVRGSGSIKVKVGKSSKTIRF